MEITLFGPNLQDQSKGQFHAHATGCGDCAKYERRREYGWKIDMPSRFEVSAELNSDILSDYGLTDQDEEGREMLRDWLSDIWFAPCLANLPMDEEV